VRHKTHWSTTSHNGKQIHKFRSEEDEREFWAKNDSTEIIDWQLAQDPEIKALLRTISLPLLVSMIEDQGLSCRAVGRG
jgi:hypothetical protein